jgi:serine/threonine protein phosphatase PrpC
MDIKFKIAAWSEAAGRPENEDSFLLSDNLSDQNWAFTTDQVITLSEKGTLLVVCDGMGGMNAGEVASAIAVDTVKEWFASERLVEAVTETPETVQDYIKQAIVAADSRVREEGENDADREGMGSTIVLAWMIGKYVYVGWCGDSRAYRYNPVRGLEQISHDHSYVQDLVDAGKLTPEQAFDHPHSNVVTRSLGDTRQTACPDVTYFPLCNDDIILLCSDGLSGVLRDSEIETILANNTDSMGNCRSALWNESQKAGWQDNVTIILSRILSGGETAKKVKKKPEQIIHSLRKMSMKTIFLIVVIQILLLVGVFGGGYFLGKGESENPCCTKEQVKEKKNDSIKVDALKDSSGVKNTIEESNQQTLTPTE